MRRKIWTTGLVALCVFGASVVVAACGGSGGTTTSSSSETAETTSPATETTSPATETTGSTSSTGEWPAPNADLANTRVAPESTIDSGNVSTLGVAWTHRLETVEGFGSFAAQPLIANGVVYLQDLKSNVFALELATGKELWNYKVGETDGGPNGVAVSEGVVFAASPKSVFALEAETGKLIWKNSTVTGGKTVFDTQPAVSDGKVYIVSAGSGAEHGSAGVAFALDAKTGKVLWSFDTVPHISRGVEKGGTGAGGGWNAPLISPDGSVSFGVGNPYQSFESAVKYPSRLLYSDSTINLDQETGKLRWFYQAIPDDMWDRDMQLSPIETSVNGKPVIVDSGKMGFVYAMDAKTGKLLWKQPVGKHGPHDEDGEKALHHEINTSTYKTPFELWPGEQGGVEVNMATDGTAVYAPVSNLPFKISDLSEIFGSTDFETGTGEMVALDLKTGKPLWATKLKSIPLGDATIAGDLVFTTLYNGELVAMSRKTGEVVFTMMLPAGANAPLAIAGDMIIAPAAVPLGKSSAPQIVAYKLGATGSVLKPEASAPAEEETTKPASASGEGEEIFSANCATCHTLAAASATGTVGPNLDQLKPSEATVEHQVINGGGPMPAFKGTLSSAEIKSVAAFVAESAGK